MNRVPISIPPAPKANAANKPRPSPMPPLANTGIDTESTTRGVRTILFHRLALDVLLLPVRLPLQHQHRAVLLSVPV